MIPAPRTQYELRPASLDDVPALAALLTRCRLEHVGRPSSLAEAEEHLTEPGTDPTRDAVVVASAEGDLIGFGRVWRVDAHEVKCFARVDPARTGRGVGTALLVRLEERAREIGERGSSMTLTHWAADIAAPALLRSRRFVETRYFLRMHAGLADVRPAVPTPSGVAIRPYRPGVDDESLFAAFVDAFATHWGYEDPEPSRWWRERRDSETAGYDPKLWHVAIVRSEIAGFCLCQIRVDASGASGYVSDVGVRPPWQGRGVGHALLAHGLDTLRKRGLATASLDVDAENTTGALALYRKVGMEPMPLFTIWTKPLA